jgi:hypothetical protein
MWEWLRRNREPRRTLRVRSRDEASDATLVDFAELAPDIDTFLGQAAYLQLGFFETLSELISATPGLADKEALSRAAGSALDKHEKLVALIRADGDDPTALMLPFREQLDAFRDATHGMRTPETTLSVHITAGMLDDFYVSLSTSYGEKGREVARILRTVDDRQGIADIVTRTIASDPEWASLLSLWGRRLVGDTLLVARAALAPVRLDQSEEKRVEPVFTELLAAHDRRMADMGLAA